MAESVLCPGCGFALQLPDEGPERDAYRCPWCGASPASQPRRAPARPAAEPALARAERPSSPQPEFESEPDLDPEPVRPTPPAPAAPPPTPARSAALLDEDEEDDGQPYEMEQDGPPTFPCPDCTRPLPAGSLVCNHCGLNMNTGRRTAREYQPIDKQWEAGWPFEKRFAVFLALQVVNVITGFMVWQSRGSLPVPLGSALVFCGLQAFLLGTYYRINLERNRRGQVRLTRTWRYCFIPRPAEPIPWRDHESIRMARYDGTGVLEWWMFGLLVPQLVIPAIVWWWYAIRPSRVYVAICKDHGFPETLLYRGLNEEMARDIAQSVSDATGLPLALNG